MSQVALPGWTSVRRDCGQRPGWLRISYPAEQGFWPEVARSYWDGELANLEPVESSERSRVQRGRVESAGRGCYFKRLPLRDRGDRLKHLVRPSRAARALRGAQTLAAHGFRAPPSLCLIERCRFGAVVGSALITEALKDSTSVHEALVPGATRLPAEPRRELLRQLGREVGAMHRQGLYHGDMNVSNVLFAEDRGGFVFHWLDNERVREYSALPAKRRIHNLRQLNKLRSGLTRSDRLRFWNAYAESSALSRGESEVVRRETLRLTEAYWRRWGGEIDARL